MKGYIWKEGTPTEEAKGAYWERNMMALKYANRVNTILKAFFSAMKAPMPKECLCGWYYDTDNNWEGWKRIISLDGGEITFHIPDNFNIGALPMIEPNWDGHTTKEKWRKIARSCGASIEWKNEK